MTSLATKWLYLIIFHCSWRIFSAITLARQMLGIARALKMIAYVLIAPLFGAVAQKLPPPFSAGHTGYSEGLRGCGSALCH
tara:strand:- start:77 stop:319 length:243 start_codon:yes stop_codon:yes gene_type:complete